MGDASNYTTLPTGEATDAAGVGAHLFEVAWEVCNQVGGIYQVLRSKVPLMMERWGDRYTLVGPYNEAKANLEFEPTRPAGWIGKAIAALEAKGLKVHHGRWLISGKPRVLLIEHWTSQWQLGEIKYKLWVDHGIDFPGQDHLVDGVATFADSVRRLFEALCESRQQTGSSSAAPNSIAAAPTGTTSAAAALQNIGLSSLSAASGKAPQRAIIAHFHEWMAGLAIPMIRRQNLPVATVFTTHATLLGRYIASGADNFYDALPHYDQAAMAAHYNISTQHKIERACAHGSHVFTTVSSVTAEECLYLLGRPIDVILPNGLNVGRYNLGQEQQNQHGQFKERIHQFVMGHFFPSYSFDLDKTLYFFTSGRYEPRNKGFDLCLESLARLNLELKAHNVDKTVIFFIVTSKPTRSLNPLALEKRGVVNELRRVCESITESVQHKLFERAAAGEKMKLDDLVDEYWTLRYRRTQQAMKQHCLPMVVTHILEDDAHDPVLGQLRYLNLVNRKEDPVKVVYHPEFINPANPLWGMEYDQFVRGCHLGLFPSAYEPWGYTPLEAMAMGVPSVTSDLAGFGRYVAENFLGHDEWGMTVLRRRGRSFSDAAGELASKLLDFCKLDRRERIALRNAVDRRSWDFDWARLGPAYHTAHDLAIERFLGDAVHDPLEVPGDTAAASSAAATLPASPAAQASVSSSTHTPSPAHARQEGRSASPATFLGEPKAEPKIELKPDSKPEAKPAYPSPQLAPQRAEARPAVAVTSHDGTPR